ncbi:hypothetical protein HBA54_20140 [Pelagibius litoralis]|uniref:Uncharacterized protein n=1 Tax=Pelagibius litoralis TaxID=374515 RepID=A0A967F0U5_9PROT|nr:hypothetical protein [Pelagibius litoralis]NIA70915.1 hypothetical protein [Pelagibius litoralis]
MTKILTAVMTTAFLLSSGANLSLADPAVNEDGSQTCNASGASTGVANGVCANDLATNEGYCDGGWSTEPGGGTTCSEPNASNSQELGAQKLKAAAPMPTRQPSR